MKLQINYRHLAAEFVIVVVGVALALAADGWLDRRTELRQERLALNDLAEELNQNLEDIEATWLPRHFGRMFDTIVVLRAMYGLSSDQSLYEETLSNLRSGSNWNGLLAEFYIQYALNPILNNALSKSPVQVEIISLRGSYRLNTYGPTLASLDVLFQSGAVGNIQNDELRAKLATLPIELNDLIAEEDLLTEQIVRSVRPALARATNSNVSLAIYPRMPLSSETLTMLQGLQREKIDILPTEELAFVLSERIEQNNLTLVQLGLVKSSFEEILGLIGD